MPRRRLARSRSALLADLDAVIGGPATLALVAALGGEQVYVPADPGPEHPITRAIGADAAAQLARHYHSTHLVVPLGAMRRARVLALAATGLRAAAIQRETRYSRTFVYKVLAEDRDGDAGDDDDGSSWNDSRQSDLFAAG